MKMMSIRYKKFFLIFSLTLLTSLFNSACLKKQNLEEEDLGPAIESTELTTALGKAYGTYDFNELKVNELNSYVLSQRIQDSYIETIEQQDLNLKSFSNTTDRLSLNVLATKIKYSGGQSSFETREWNINFEKSSGRSLLNSLDKKTLSKADSKADEPYFLFMVFQSLAFGSCVNSGEYPESCHRLKVEDIQYRVPQSAYSQHNCNPESTCTIPATKIEFDMIRYYITDKDGKPKRTHYTLVISKEVPFLSRVLQFCSRSLYDITSGQQKILADLCYNVNNYAFGNAESN